MNIIDETMKEFQASEQIITERKKHKGPSRKDTSVVLRYNIVVRANEKLYQKLLSIAGHGKVSKLIRTVMGAYCEAQEVNAA